MQQEMDDYSALAQRISVSAGGVTGALILSRDGLVLGADPEESVSLAKPAWLRFIALGEPDKSFVEFPDQVWAYVRRGPYAAFVIAEAGIRPGVLIDQMDQVLLTAEEARSRRDTFRVPDTSAAPSGKPRAPLHPQRARSAPAEVAAEATGPMASADASDRPPPPVASADGPLDALPDEPPASVIGEEVEDPQGAPSALKKEPQKLAGTSMGAAFDDDSEVDRVLLAKEFSGLLQVDSGDDEAIS